MPKKLNKSPFGLFVRKTSFENHNFHKPMVFSQRVKVINQLYHKLSDDEKKPFVILSQLIRDKGLTDQQIDEHLRRLDTISDVHHNEDDGDDWDNSDTNVIKTNVMKNIKKEEKTQELDDYSRVKNAIERHNDVKCIPIIVVSFNLLVKTIDGKCYPNEVGLIKLTIKDGIEDTYHKLIYNKIPIGYYSVASDHSSKTHKIPIDPLDESLYERNYDSLYKEIYDFMDLSVLIDSENKKLVFCKSIEKMELNLKRQIIGCLQWLENENKNDCNKKSFANFKVIDLTELAFVLSQPLRVWPKYQLRQQLSKFVYDFVGNTNCPFHDQIENNCCALGVVKRLSYMFFDCTLQWFNVEPKPTHKPIEHVFESEISSVKLRENNRTFLYNEWNTIKPKTEPIDSISKTEPIDSISKTEPIDSISKQISKVVITVSNNSEKPQNIKQYYGVGRGKLINKRIQNNNN